MRNILTKFFLMLIDTIIIILSAFLAVFLRFDGDVPYNYLQNTITSLPALVAARLITFYFLKLYSRVWRYASIREFSIIVVASMTSSMFFYLYLMLTNNAYALPRSVHIISMMLVVLGVLATRLAVRIYSHYKSGYMQSSEVVKEKKILIVGAGDAGAIIAREILQNKKSGQKIVGFVDDDKSKIGMSMFGSKIIGSRNNIVEIAQKYYADEIIIAMPSVNRQEVRQIVDICQKTECKIRITPSIYELIDGKFTLDQVRDIDVEDLLGRDAVKLEQGKIQTYIQDKTILVTGAGGSIGSEICIQTAKINPQKIILLGKGENSIYDIHYKLNKKFPNIKVIPIIADVRDKKRIEDVFEQYKPNVVFHAAAHKHVPLMEAQPEEAVKNNILGTKTVAEASIKYLVERFIMISTDKAVNPTSVMGATKRVAEMIVTNIGKNSKTIFATVRFGNVLGSRGSVIPLFKQQIAEGGPITVTHPEMKRYFMTIPEASQLVLQAGAMANGGEVFVLDMGKPVKITDLAIDLIKLSGYIPNEDIKIEFIGLRKGEKLFEELLTDEEGTTATEHAKVFIANMIAFEKEKLDGLVDNVINSNGSEEIISIISNIVTSYKPNR